MMRRRMKRKGGHVRDREGLGEQEQGQEHDKEEEEERQDIR